jgi:hypothetical protein
MLGIGVFARLAEIIKDCMFRTPDILPKNLGIGAFL